MNEREYRALQNKRKTKHKIIHAAKPPLGPEISYRDDLLGLTKEVNDEVVKRIFPLLTGLEPYYIQDTPRQDMLKQLDLIQKMFAPINSFSRRVAELFVMNVSNTNKKRLQQSFNKSFGFSMVNLLRDENIVKPMQEHIDTNVDLIKTIAPENLMRLKKIISNGMTQGKTAGDIRQELRVGFDISERRARLIARDQTSKINGNLNKVRSQDAGVTHYVWIGREDDLERPTHVANNNKIFAWANPPKQTGHPGEDYQCRCYAKLIITI